MGTQISEPTGVDWNVYVVHPAHPRPKDDAYHSVIDALSAVYWQTPLQLATESGQSLKDVRRVLNILEREGAHRGDTVIDEARSDEGKCYRIAGGSHREEQ